MREFLTEEEIASNPRLVKLRRGKELIPRCVLLASRRAEVTADDIAWAHKVMGTETGRET